jgi:hypothetical protein
LPDLDDRSVSYLAGLSHIEKKFKKMLDKKGWHGNITYTTLWYM